MATTVREGPERSPSLRWLRHGVAPGSAGGARPELDLGGRLLTVAQDRQGDGVTGCIHAEGRIERMVAIDRLVVDLGDDVALPDARLISRTARDDRRGRRVAA